MNQSNLKNQLLIIYKPKYKDLWFKSQLLQDKETMSYNHAYGGTIDFPKEKWKDWYEKWVEANDEKRFYRYVMDASLHFVGEIAYYFNNDKVYCDVIIMAKERNKGYGTEAIKILCEEAKTNGVKELYDEIAIDNPSVKLFLKQGFSIVSKNEDSILVKKIL